MTTNKQLWRLKPKLYTIDLRQRLLNLHADLFDIDDQIRKINIYYPNELTILERMVVILEDRRFFSHFGVDIPSAIREVVKLVFRRRHGGASTIDMQFVRTITGYKETTIKRKLYECLLSLVIQRRYSKIQILRAYLDCAFFGSHLIGATKASKKMYGVKPFELQTMEASFIAAMLVSPRPNHPSEKWLSRVQRRADYGYTIYINDKDRFDKLPG